MPNVVADVTSLDGWTNTAGVAHRLFLESGRSYALGCCVDVQLADLRGSDYTFNGVFAYVEPASCLPPGFWLSLQTGSGYRDNPDFSCVSSRIERLWRGSVEQRKDTTQQWSISVFATYDRFATDNALFDAERCFGGIVATYQFTRPFRAASR